MKKIYLTFCNYLDEERGLGTVEMVVLVVVLIGLALLFRRQITGIITGILDNIDTETITIQSFLSRMIWYV